MEQNISEQIMNVINQIAEKLGVAAEKLYPILRRQAMIEGLSRMFFLIAFIPTTYFVIDIFRKVSKYNDESETFSTGGFVLLVLLVITVIFVTLGFIANVVNIGDIATALFNPDWYIINNILKKLVR